MAESVETRLLTWTIPTPRGLWHRAVVLIDGGMFITPDIDATTLADLKAAVAKGHEATIETLTGHGRAKRSRFLRWDAVAAIKLNQVTGEIDVELAEGEPVSLRVPDRDRLEKLVRVLAATWRSATAASAEG